MDKVLVVSNYNWNLEWIKNFVIPYGFSQNNIIIFNKSNDNLDWSHIGKVIESPNVGANPQDILQFIVDNYNNLPDMSIFIKGNVLFSDKGENYYTTIDRFIKLLHSDTFFSAWVDMQLLNNDYRHLEHTKREILEDGRLVQPISHCNFGSNPNVRSRYFSNHHDLLDWCFINPPKTDTIEFIPSSNISLPKKNILKYSKNLYKKLLSIVSWEPERSPNNHNLCAEAYLLERIFYLMWSQDLQEKTI